jgi:putative addiction module component (TIGR02574 family)
MGNQLEMLEVEALKLTSGERAAFAQVLLASLDEDAEIEEAWASEVERRIADVESGAVQVIPIADALAQVRAALSERQNLFWKIRSLAQSIVTLGGATFSADFPTASSIKSPLMNSASLRWRTSVDGLATGRSASSESLETRKEVKWKRRPSKWMA